MAACNFRLAAKAKANVALEAALAAAGATGITTQQAATATGLSTDMAKFHLSRAAFAVRARTQAVQWARWFHVDHRAVAAAYVAEQDARRYAKRWSPDTSNNAAAMLLRAGPAGTSLDGACAALGMARAYMSCVLAELARDGLCVTIKSRAGHKTYYAPEHAPARGAMSAATRTRANERRAAAPRAARQAQQAAAAAAAAAAQDVTYLPGWTYQRAAPVVDRRFSVETPEPFFSAGRYVESDSAVARAYGGQA